MILPAQTCDAALLRLAVANQLPPAEEELLAAHLEQCLNCRQQLDALSGGMSWSGEVRQILSSVGWSRTAGLTEGGQISVSRIGKSSVEDVGSALRSLLEPTDQPGQLGRLGPYSIEKVIGRGGMGVVFKAFDTALCRHVAIKVLAPELLTDVAAKKRFLSEARSAAAIVNDHVVAIHAVDMSGDVPYLVMPLVAGPSLQQRLSTDDRLPLQEVVQLAWQMADGLAAAHARGLVHCDVKPANILLEGGQARVKITDFGLARAGDDSCRPSHGIAGTPQYMSPEQACGHVLDHRSDLFSLGSVIYAMCVGHSPFRAESTANVLQSVCQETPRPLDEVRADVPVWLSDIVAKLLAKQPADRYQTASEVAGLLTQRWPRPHRAEVGELSSGSRPRLSRGGKYIIGATSLLLPLVSAAWLISAWLGPRTTTQPAALPEIVKDAVVPDNVKPAQPFSNWPDDTPELEFQNLQRDLDAIEQSLDSDAFGS